MAVGLLGNQGNFEPPGGRLEYGETFKACAVREVRRETGLEVKAKAVVSVTEDVWGGDRWEKHFVSIFVLCDLKDDMDPIEVRPSVFLFQCSFFWHCSLWDFLLTIW